MKEIWQEGKVLFLFFGVLGIVFGILAFVFSLHWAWIISGLSWFLVGYTVFFLRIPNRNTVENPEVIYASADGYIFDIQENVKAPVYIQEPVHKIVIFMHVASVHWNMAPVSGEIEYTEYQKGKFKNALTEASWQENENQKIGMRFSYGKILVVMVAGLIARRIRFFKKEKDNLKQGERFGLIKYGSANILYIPANFEILVKKGQKSRAGLTILARKK